jgi:AcrR family transcriptional regulator
MRKMPAREVNDTPPADRRRAHGARTRREIIEAALRIAATEGLESLTIGRLATDVGMSKAGLFAHFGSKEALQIATLDAAWEIYCREVLEPTATTAPGAPQLRALMEHYFAYVQRHVTRGGCFFNAVSSEFDDRKGPVHDRVLQVMAERNLSIERVLREAVAAGHLPKNTDIAQMSYEVLALVAGTNLLFQLSKDPQIFQRAWRALAALTPPRRSRESSQA